MWAGAGTASLFLSPRIATFVLILATGLIFPLGLLFAKVRGERLANNTNPLAKLMAMCVLMVNLLWALHLSLLFAAPTLVPLSIAIALGIHWIVFSWIIQHPSGIVHAIMRTILATAAWWALPSHRIAAVAGTVVLSYLVTIWALATRSLNRI